MATTYDLSTFHRNVLPRGISSEEVGVIQAALGIGWTVVVKGVTARLVAPAGNKSLVFSASGRNAPLEQYKRIIYKHGNPLLMEQMTSDEKMHEMVENVVAAELVAERAAKSVVAEPVTEPKTVTTPEPVKVSVRKLVSIGPMIARRSQGRGYPSETTNERRWSDGTVDFSCQFDGCDYASDERRSVGAHWRTHAITDGLGPRKQPKPTVQIEDYEVAHREGYTPRRERVGALAEVLDALDLDKMSAEELAEFVLHWQHEQSSTGTRLAAEREELTSDDVLNRIRALLDNGTYLRQRDEIAALRDEMGRRRDSEAEALTRAQNAEDKWTALRELMDA